MRVRRLMGAGLVGALAFGGVLAASVVSSVPAGATTTTVTNTADDGSDTSLRAILEYAVPGDVIELVPGATYTLDLCEPKKFDSVDPAISINPGELTIFQPITINGNGATIDQTCPGWRVIHTIASLTVNDLTVTGGTSTGGGGGGIRVDPQTLGADLLPKGMPTELVINDSSIVGNCTTDSGGGFKMNTVGDVEINNSTIAGNQADDRGGGFSHSHEGDVTMVNSTVSGNEADYAGGVDVRHGFFTTVYSDVVDNEIIAGTDCGVFDSDGSAVEEDGPTPFAAVDPANVSAYGIRAFATVIAMPVNGVNCAKEGVESLGYNYVDDLTCGLAAATDRASLTNDPLIGPLAANGGPTLTHLPKSGSPLVDAIPLAGCDDGDAAAGYAVKIDQRHLVRPDVVNQKCDIGSVEIQTEAVEIQPNFTG